MAGIPHVLPARKQKKNYTEKAARVISGQLCRNMYYFPAIAACAAASLAIGTRNGEQLT